MHCTVQTQPTYMRCLLLLAKYLLSGPLQALLNLKGVPVNAHIAQELTAPVLTTESRHRHLTVKEESPENTNTYVR